MIELNVKEIANEIRTQIKDEIINLNIKPHLATILVGNDQASQKYVSNKNKLCENLGIENTIHTLDKNIQEDILVDLINKLNDDSNINGIIIQLPLPKHLNTIKLINLISPEKDVDGLTIINQGKLFNNMPTIYPCTPFGIIKILEHLNENVSGKNICVIGRSNLLGKPLASMLTNLNATVTTCHTHTKNLNKILFDSDIIISCTGQHGIINPYILHSNVLVIDAGTTFKDGKLVGDFDITLDENTFRNNIRYTPVPFGVGQMTTTMLCYNTLLCYKLQNNL